MANITVIGTDYQNVDKIYLKETETGDELTFTLDSGGGGGTTRTVVIPEQTIVASTTYNSISSFAEPLELGEQYVYTINGVEHTAYGVDLYGSVAIHADNTPCYFEYDRGMYFTVNNSADYGTYTVKVEKIVESSSGGGDSSAATLITKEITANGTYSASDDSADGYSQVTVNVPSQAGAAMNTQVAQGVDRVATTSYTAVIGQSITVEATGTYDVYWTGFRSSTGGTNGSQLYIDNVAYGTAQTTFTNHGQSIKLTGVQLTVGQVVSVRARARGTNYYMYVGNLTIEQTA